MKSLSLRKLLAVLLACDAGAGLLFAVSEPVPVNALCPITGKRADSGKTATYIKEIKFCCDICKETFNKDPDDRVKEVSAITPGTRKCLMCDKPADKDIKTSYLRVVALSDNESLTQFKASPDKYIVFAVTHPRPVNTVCPMSGGEVDPKCTVPYQKTVLFCSQVCHDSFNKSPDENVGKVAVFDRKKEKCLMCDTKYDPAHIEVYRRVIGFNTQSHAVAFNATADANLAKAVKGTKVK